MQINGWKSYQGHSSGRNPGNCDQGHTLMEMFPFFSHLSFWNFSLWQQHGSTVMSCQHDVCQLWDHILRISIKNPEIGQKNPREGLQWPTEWLFLIYTAWHLLKGSRMVYSYMTCCNSPVGNNSSMVCQKVLRQKRSVVTSIWENFFSSFPGFLQDFSEPLTCW